jgi:type 1 glutamine amidotransferase
LKNIFVLFCVFAVTSVISAQEKTEPPKKIRVLFVTGEDYPGHLWREIGPVVRNNLNTDPNIDCRLTDDLEILGTDIVFDYDVLVCYFKNYAPLKNDVQAKKNLLLFVENGGGLILLHFTCGAFEDWAEYEKLAGRVWNPKLRGHDPFGKFTVEITNKSHPITQNIENFETTDELYTCLKSSDIPIHVLAESTSKIDGQRYPMAFVLELGRGRIFHTLLGHNAAGFTPPNFVKMLNKAVHWTAKKI